MELAESLEFWIAQGVAIIICILTSLSYFYKKKTSYLLTQFVVNLLYCIQYVLLGAIPAAVNNVIALVKYIIFYKSAKENKKNPVWQVILFSIISLVCGLIVLDSIDGLVPVVTTLMFTYAVWQDNPVVLRIVVILCNLLWIMYNFNVKAYVSAVYSLIELIISLITLIMLVKKSKEKLKD